MSTSSRDLNYYKYPPAPGTSKRKGGLYDDDVMSCLFVPYSLLNNEQLKVIMSKHEFFTERLQLERFHNIVDTKKISKFIVINSIEFTELID